MLMFFYGILVKKKMLVIWCFCVMMFFNFVSLVEYVFIFVEEWFVKFGRIFIIKYVFFFVYVGILRKL